MTALFASPRSLHASDSVLDALKPFAIAALLALGNVTLASAEAPARNYQGLGVEVIGSGRPLVMIPGLNSAADTWRETCVALQPDVQCHLLQLPGFAGQPAIASDAFLDAMRERVLEIGRAHV